MKKVLFPAFVIASMLLTGCSGSVKASAGDYVARPTPDPATLIDAATAKSKALAITGQQKGIVVPNKLAFTEQVDVEEVYNGKIVDNFSYDYLMQLDKETGYYRTHVDQNSIKYNNTLGRNISYHTIVNIWIWTDSAYRTTMCQEYIKYQEGTKITNEKIYAKWNMGYYQDYSTVFGSGKLGALKDILNHFFSDSADEGEQVEEKDFGEYNVSHIDTNFLGKNELAECVSASTAIAAGQDYRGPYTDCKNYKGAFYSNGTDNLQYERSYDVPGIPDEKYGTLTVSFDQITTWTDSFCTSNYDQRHFFNSTYTNKQTVLDYYYTDDFEETVPDVTKDGWSELDLTY